MAPRNQRCQVRNMFRKIGCDKNSVFIFIVDLEPLNKEMLSAKFGDEAEELLKKQLAIEQEVSLRICTFLLRLISYQICSR